MNDSDKLDDCKKEIRDVLATFHKKCSLSDFNQAYKKLTGRELPCKESGFPSDIAFLHSMPDVVEITQIITGDYLLHGVADEKAKGRRAVVAKQKTAQSQRSKYTKGECYLQDNTDEEDDDFRLVGTFDEKSRGIQQKPATSQRLRPSANDVQRSREVEHRKTLQTLDLREMSPFKTESELRYSGPDVSQTRTNEYHLQNSISEGSKLKHEATESNPNTMELPWSIRCTTAVRLKNIAKEVRQPTSSSDIEMTMAALRAFQLRSIEESKDQETVSKPNQIRQPISSMPCSKVVGSRVASPGLSEVKNISQLYPGEHELSSETLRQEPKPLSNYLENIRLDAESNEDVSSDSVNPQSAHQDFSLVCLKHFIEVLRSMLRRCPEGVKIEDIMVIYNVILKDSVSVQDFGFDDIETFLSAIAHKVPLMIDFDEKLVYAVERGDKSLNSDICKKEAIHFDGGDITTDFVYKALTLPSDLSQYFPVYTSSIIDPGHFYIQLNGKDSELRDAFIKLSEDLNTFYDEHQSEQYVMKDCHLRMGTPCIAKWPTDNCWYRAQIASLESMEDVRVQYVDFGAMSVIHKSLLRYVVKKFTHLPVHAVKCQLAFIKPKDDDKNWDPCCREILLKFCTNILLMAKIVKIGYNGVCSIILCDANNKDDVLINVVLCNAKFAEYITSPQSYIPTSWNELQHGPNWNPIQQLQHQNFPLVRETIPSNLSGQVTRGQYAIPAKQTIGMPCVLPTVPEYFSSVPQSLNIHANTYANPFQRRASTCQHADPVLQTTGMPFMSSTVPQIFNSVPQGMNTVTHANPYADSLINALLNIYAGGAASASAICPMVAPNTNVMNHSCGFCRREGV